MQQSGRGDARRSRADPDRREKRRRVLEQFRLLGAVFVALVGGAATAIAGIGGKTSLPAEVAVALATFVTVGLAVVFYIEDVAGSA